MHFSLLTASDPQPEKGRTFWDFIDGIPTQILVGALVCLVVLIIVLVFLLIVFKIHFRLWGMEFNIPPESQGNGLPSPNGTERLKKATQFLQSILDKQVRDKTTSLVEQLEQLPAIDDELFKEAINIDYSEFLIEVKNWTNSCVRIQGQKNDNFLLKIYSTAKKNIFSTCIEEYLIAWKSPLGIC